VVANVRVKQEGERILLVFEDVPDVVRVLLVQRVHRDIVAGVEVVFLGARTDVLVSRVDDVDAPLVGPAVDKIVNLLEVLVVVDEHRIGQFEVELVCYFEDEIQCQRRVLATSPHHDRVLVLFEPLLGYLDCLLYLVLDPGVIARVLSLSCRVIDVDVLRELRLVRHF